MTWIKATFWSLLALATSRRSMVLVSAGLLFAVRWRLLGPPPTEEWVGLLAVVGAWTRSESERRHGEALASSRRFIVAALAAVLPAVLAGAGVVVPPEAVASASGLVAAWILGEGARRHEVSEEDAPPAPAAEDGGP